MCCKMKNAAFLKKSKYCYSLTVNCGTSVAEAVLQLWKQILKIHWFVVDFFSS